ncbi:MAG: aldo/keto reductase [Pseudomonadota bacterium]
MTHKLGLGCWPLSGPMFLDGKSVGYATCPPQEAERILHAAYDHGIRLFDTAHAYGCGHGERQLGQALAGKDVEIVTKIGLAIDEDTKTITGPRLDATEVAASVDESLARLGRDHVDVVLIHPNDAEIPVAEAIFEELEKLVSGGKVGAFGWSTDFPERAASQSRFPHATHVEHVMNVFFDAAELRAATSGLTHLIRSPLAMGVLAGRFEGGEAVAAGDVRVESHGGLDWFQGDRVHPRFAERLAAIRELLMTGGRSLAQGSLAWLWAQEQEQEQPGTIVPVPGASKIAQVEDNAAALAKGPLASETVEEIAQLIPREPWQNRPL